MRITQRRLLQDLDIQLHRQLLGLIQHQQLLEAGLEGIETLARQIIHRHPGQQLHLQRLHRQIIHLPLGQQLHLQCLPPVDVRRLAPGEPAEGGVGATLRRALVLDPVVRLELECTSGEHELIEARLGTAQFEALGLREGDTVRVAPRARSEAAAAAPA